MTLKEPPPPHEALFLPLEEDSLLFQICFYYGLLVVLVEVVVPLLFQRRLRLFLPNVLPQAPLLSDDAFQQQKTQLSTQLRELQRASSAAKKKKKKQWRKSVDTAGLSNGKKTPSGEGAASRGYSASHDATSKPRLGIRPPSSVRAQSAGKSATSSVTNSASRAREFEARRLKQGVNAVAEGSLPPSKLQQPSRPFFASTSSAVQGTSTTPGAGTGVTSSSAPSPRQSSGERRPPERRLSVGGTGAKAWITDTQQRQVQREMRRYSWQRETAEEDDGLPASKLPQPSFSYSSTRREVHDDSIDTASSTTNVSSEKQRTHERSDRSESEAAEMDPQQEFRRDEPIEFASAEYDNYYDDEEETLLSESPKRSIAPFAPTQQSIFDDSDEEFLTVIRRPRSPVAMAPGQTFTSFGSEQMDVERTISAAFGGRPLGGGATAIPTTHYQPLAAGPPVAPAPAPYHQVNMYEQPQAHAHPQQHQQQQYPQQQQRNQFITSRRETPDARSHRQEEAFGAANYREVARDRTPKIIRKIAFDEEMMALAATPDANAAAAAGEKRKRSKIFSPEDEAQDYSRRRTRL